jgi:hypothetical protein
MNPFSSVKEVDWEVLPPEEKRKRQGWNPLFKWLALIMDEFICVPGTKFKFGLDPLIGLLPGLGDTGSALVSAFALIQAARLGVPKILLARMSLNILINELVEICAGWSATRSRSGSSQTRVTITSSRTTPPLRVAFRAGAIGFLLSRCWRFSLGSFAADYWSASWFSARS